MAYWLLKTEPEVYSYQDLDHEGETVWEGVANALALKHLNSMKKGDIAIIYHTGKEKTLVGIAKIVSNPYHDPRKKEPTLMVVDVRPKKALARAVTLSEIKSRKEFDSFELVRLPRLSVVPVRSETWKALMNLAHEPVK
jgi:predicted RNA-binding protein with PUA-like domain